MNKIFKFIIAILCSAILGGILGSMDVDLELNDWVLIWCCVVTSILLLIFLRSINSMKLLSKGEYSKAIQGFERIIENQGKNKKILNAMLYNISICHYRNGEFNKSENCLDKMDLTCCDDNIKWGYFNLRASNLMLLEENIDVIEDYFDKAAQLFNPEEGYPRLTYFEGVKGNQKEALRYIEGYVNKEKKRKVIFRFRNTLLLFDKFVYDIENNFFLGMAYIKLNEPKLAKEYLGKANNGQYENYFSKRAGEILNDLEN